MSDYGYNNGYGGYNNGYDSRDGYDTHDEHQGGALGKADAQAALQRGLDAGMNSFERTDPNASAVKVAGISIDAGIYNAIVGVYSAVCGEVTRLWSPKLYDTIVTHAPKIKISGKELSGSALHRTAAGATLAVNMGIFVGGSVVKLANDVIDQQRSRAAMARELAPVLDELMGKHSVGAYNSVTADKNSVIWADRMRRSKEAHTLNTSTIMSALANNVVNFAGQAMNVRSLMTGEHREALFLQKHEKDADELRNDIREKLEGRIKRSRGVLPEAGSAEAQKLDAEIESKLLAELHKEHDGNAGRMTALGLNLSLPTLLGKLAKSSMERLKKTRQPYSAWDMIKTLSEQMQNNPGGDSHFQLPGQHGRELPLEKYVAEIFKQHQREMCDLDPQYSELRQSLHDDLDELVKPIAEALRGGKLNPLMLTRLAGENKVIKNHGRGLASVTVVQTTLETYAGKSHRINTTDPKEYLSERNFSLEHAKDSLHTLKGEERLNFAAVFPDGLLKSLGLSEKEIQAVQAHRAQEGFKHLQLNAVMGMNEKSDDELKNGGLGSAQIKQLHEGAQVAAAEGLQAFEGLLGSPTNASGIENIVADFVVPKLAIGDGQYLGKLVAKGQEVLKNTQTSEESANVTDEARAGEMADAAIARAQSGTRGREGKGSHTKKIKEEREAQHDSIERDF